MREEAQDAKILAAGKLPELRQRAGAGDRVSATLLLNRALAHKQITATVTQQNDLLEIRLTGPTWHSPTGLILICRELQHWPLPSTALVVLEHLDTDSDIPNWHKTISVNELDRLAQGGYRLEDDGLPSKRYKSAAEPVPTAAMLPTNFHVQAFDLGAAKALGAGSLLALLVFLSHQVSFFLSYFVILVHELGHTACSWIFGFPAIPAFDFLHGGGISVSTNDRYFVIIWLIYAGLGWGMYRYRHNRLTVQVLVAVSLIYSVLAFSSLQTVLRVAMGHGFELIFAGMFCYRGLSGFACRYSIERPLYLMLGLFTILYDLRFGWKLLFDPVSLNLYLQGKGGLMDHDLVRIARDHLGVSLSIVVWGFLLLTVATPLITVGLYRYRQWMVAAFLRLFFVLKD